MPRPQSMRVHSDNEPIEVPIATSFAVPTTLAVEPMPEVSDPSSGPTIRSGPVARPETVEHEGLEHWSRKMLDYIPDAEADQVRECATMSGAPIWHVIAGYILRCRESGMLFAPIIMEEWGYMQNPRAPKPCAICGTVFTPANWGQLYCSNPCGSKADRDLNRTRYTATHGGSARA